MKKRLDILLVERGLAQSRQKAQALILSGEVRINGISADKNGQTADENADITVSGGARYVSRGGLKLERALEVFPIDLTDCFCADIGASTGGFTDCMLQNGARMVYSVDVGYGQLDWQLRQDPRVVVMERTNARFIEPSNFPETPVFAGIDASFISLKLLLPALFRCLKDGALVVALIKPQFEAGKGNVGKNGVVRDKAVHGSVIRDIVDFAANEQMSVLGLNWSPITGPKGNIEFLLLLGKNIETDFVPDISDIVERAHIAHSR